MFSGLSIYLNMIIYVLLKYILSKYLLSKSKSFRKRWKYVAFRPVEFVLNNFVSNMRRKEIWNAHACENDGWIFRRSFYLRKTGYQNRARSFRIERRSAQSLSQYPHPKIPPENSTILKNSGLSRSPHPRVSLEKNCYVLWQKNRNKIISIIIIIISYSTVSQNIWTV